MKPSYNKGVRQVPLLQDYETVEEHEQRETCNTDSHIVKDEEGAEPSEMEEKAECKFELDSAR